MTLSFAYSEEPLRVIVPFMYVSITEPGITKAIMRLTSALNSPLDQINKVIRITKKIPGHPAHPHFEDHPGRGKPDNPGKPEKEGK